MIIGKKYKPVDNSYCINLATQVETFIVQVRDMYYRPTPEEDGAEFTIISLPFKELVYNFGVMDPWLQEFIIVKSLKTGHCYRVLYHDFAVVQE